MTTTDLLPRLMPMKAEQSIVSRTCPDQRSKPAIDLGAAFDEAGNLVADSHQRTGIAGLYVAGDVIDGINQIAVAFGHAAIAAGDIHSYLATTDQRGPACTAGLRYATAPQHGGQTCFGNL
ncbi:hypothetical protein [Mesorhizobium sp. M7A.F.Ca.ET.027.03.2.1]|uniref:hypothetical protein n=1 Tax=Mesorhizobium sp. M7A.F.Ca.ET.027.03.2.1 TaxID=2496656 RepID=UPI001FE0CEC1|nr:hypothetical protein [Mesorhizobium sp. M7A.F.Ca.ET.027.03.2.1]